MAPYFDEKRRGNPELAGKEIFEIKPVILGGSPIDPANKTALTREQHIRAVRYWNKIIADFRATGSKPGLMPR